MTRITFLWSLSRFLTVTVILFWAPLRMSAQSAPRVSGATSVADMPANVISAGAVSSASSNFILNATVAQPAIGIARSSLSTLAEGFWHQKRSMETVDADDVAVAPATLSLSGYPNPFHSSTAFRYTLSARSDLRVDIYDVLGRLVRTLTATNAEPGAHELAWDGSNARGNELPGGRYFAAMRTFNTHGLTIQYAFILLEHVK